MRLGLCRLGVKSEARGMTLSRLYRSLGVLVRQLEWVVAPWYTKRSTDEVASMGLMVRSKVKCENVLKRPLRDRRKAIAAFKPRVP